MKNPIRLLLPAIVGAAVAIVAVIMIFAPSREQYRTTSVQAPFAMAPIREFIFPDREFPITQYGARADADAADTSAVNAGTAAFARAIAACHEAGGGRVVVPAGTWVTGAIHLKSNVNLYLSRGAVISFSDRPDDYLPAVPTSWEGMECYNYSPLIYAYECENIAVTGPGCLQPQMATWRTWFGRPAAHLDALKRLYTMASTDVPVGERQMAEGDNHLRPHLLQFNRCRNVLLEEFSIRESPFWTLHLYMCDGGIVRGLDVRAHGHNNDGIDLEMSRRILVEKCRFDQGDDAVVIKSGRNRDAWRLDTPCEDIVVRHCDIVKGHTLLGIGSEMSGGVRNIYMHDCAVPDTVFRLVFVKTNHRRGGFVENIHVENISGGRMQRVLEVDTDVLYQWRNLVQTYCDSISRIEGLHLTNVRVKRTEAIYDLKGDSRLPIRNVVLKNVHADEVTQFVQNVQHTEGVLAEGVGYDLLRNNH
jgi:polygalacturonase